MHRLTKDNQGYWDRIKRARSWINRARAVESAAIDLDDRPDSQELFIMYWVGFNALYGRVNETGHGPYIRPSDEDARWFLQRVCELDAGTGRIAKTLPLVHKDGLSLLRSRYLSEKYWKEGYSPTVRRHIEGEVTEAEEAEGRGDLHTYLRTILWGRVRMLRNQIFNGCSTSRDSLNKDALEPALSIMKELIPVFIEVMEVRVDKENDWPRVPFPRRGSPLHPTT